MKMAKYCQDEVELFRLKLRVRSWLHSKGKLNPQRCLAEWLHHSQGSGSCFPGEREAEWGPHGHGKGGVGTPNPSRWAPGAACLPAVLLGGVQCHHR